MDTHRQSGSGVLGLHYNDVEPPTMEHPNHSSPSKAGGGGFKANTSKLCNGHTYKMKNSKAQGFWEERTLGEGHCIGSQGTRDPGD